MKTYLTHGLLLPEAASFQEQLFNESLFPIFKQMEEIVLILSIYDHADPRAVAVSFDQIPRLVTDWMWLNFEEYDDPHVYIEERYEDKDQLYKKLEEQAPGVQLKYMVAQLGMFTFHDEFAQALLSIFGLDENDEDFLLFFRKNSMDLEQALVFLEIMEQWPAACEEAIHSPQKGIEAFQKIYQRLEEDPFDPEEGQYDPYRIRLLFEISRFLEESGDKKDQSAEFLKRARKLVEKNRFKGLESYKAHIRGFYDVWLLQQGLDDKLLNRIVQHLSKGLKPFENYITEENYLLVLDLAMQFFSWVNTLDEKDQEYLIPWLKKIKKILFSLFETMDFTLVDLEDLEANAYAALYLARNLKMTLPREKLSWLFNQSVELYSKSFEQDVLEDLASYLEALMESFGVIAEENSRQNRSGRVLEPEVYPLLQERFEQIRKLTTMYPQLVQDPTVFEEINDLYGIMGLLEESNSL